MSGEELEGVFNFESWSTQSQQVTDRMNQYIPNMSISSMPTILEAKSIHFSPGSYGAQIQSQSPTSFNSFSSGPMSSIGHASSSTGSVNEHSLSFDYNTRAQPMSMSHKSALTDRLREQPHIQAHNDYMMYHGSPMVDQTMSPMLTSSPNPFIHANQYAAPPFPPYSSIPNMIGYNGDKDQLLSRQLDSLVPMSPDPMSPNSDWFPGSSGSVPTQPVVIPNAVSRQHHARHSSSISARHSSYSPYPHRSSLPFSPTAAPVPPILSTSVSSDFLTSSSVDNTPSFGAGFNPSQLPAAQAILQFIQMNSGVPIPSTLITDRLVEVSEGRGYCLIGNCGSERAAMKANPGYNDPADKSRKRLDHLYDHVRDIHFGCRPFQCGQCTRSFSREHDLKRHESVHAPVPLACPYPNCPKSYTREDNLKRHVTVKHPGCMVNMGPHSHSVL